MFLQIWLVAQLATTAAPMPDTIYSTTALRQFIAEAARVNRAPPPLLVGYDAHVETEVAFVLRDSLGRELTGQLEQFASIARWTRSGAYDLHVIGYRVQSAGAPLSALTVLGGWTVPVLYGERLELGIEGNAPKRASGTRGGVGGLGDTLPAVHPLAADRDTYYRYRGGDTVATMHLSDGLVRVVRVRVEPLPVADGPRGRFDGELDFDAETHALIGMRGRVVLRAPPGTRRALVTRLPGLVVAAYVELVNARVRGRYWLPAYQRTEMQTETALTGDSRSVFRVISHFENYDVHERAAADTETVAESFDSADSTRHLTMAADDSLSSYRDWRMPLGDATAAVSAADFNAYAPGPWRTTSGTSLVYYPHRPGDLFHFNRVEGAFTGVGLRARRALGERQVSAALTAGYAWSERTVRASASAAVDLGAWTLGARIDRRLASTNDFAPDVVADFGLGALLAGVDDRDYVDRRTGALSILRRVGVGDDRSLAAIASLELAAVNDRPEVARLVHGPLFPGPGFRANRGVMHGNYARATARFEWNPDVASMSVQPGVGASLISETAAGGLSYERVVGTFVGRQMWGSLTTAARFDVGVVTGRRIPPQQLFEIGGNEGLLGYDYKAFAGDRVARADTRAAYTLPVLRRPMRLWRGYVVPGIAPGLALTVQGARIDAATLAARAAIDSLGITGPGNPGPTEGIRASAAALITLFSGSVDVGVARSLGQRHDAPRGLRFVLGFAMQP